MLQSSTIVPGHVATVYNLLDHLLRVHPDAIDQFVFDSIKSLLAADQPLSTSNRENFSIPNNIERLELSLRYAAILIVLRDLHRLAMQRDFESMVALVTQTWTAQRQP